MIVQCTCRHEFQDLEHGRGKRVANETQTGNEHEKQYRCTVCGTLHKR